MEGLPSRGIWGKFELSGDVFKKALRRVSLSVGAHLGILGWGGGCSCYWKRWEIVGGLWKWNISLYGSSVREPGEELCYWGSWRLCRGSFWRRASLSIWVPLGSMARGSFTRDTLRWMKRAVDFECLFWVSSVGGTWRWVTLLGTANDMLIMALEMGICYNRSPSFEKHEKTLLSEVLW